MLRSPPCCCWMSPCRAASLSSSSSSSLGVLARWRAAASSSPPASSCVCVMMQVCEQTCCCVYVAVVGEGVPGAWWRWAKACNSELVHYKWFAARLPARVQALCDLFVACCGHVMPACEQSFTLTKRVCDGLTYLDTHLQDGLAALETRREHSVARILDCWSFRCRLHKELSCVWWVAVWGGVRRGEGGVVGAVWLVRGGYVLVLFFNCSLWGAPGFPCCRRSRAAQLPTVVCQAS